MKVYTTISSKLNDREKIAIESWSRYFDVVSINTIEEIDAISEHYPKVKFIESKEFYDYEDKKLIRLNSILEAIELQNSEICCIINSDIILDKDINKNQILNLIKYAKTGLVISCRFDFIDTEFLKFSDGYDFFMFHKREIPLIKNIKYVIGMPWWDYWIPMVFLFSKKKIYHITNKFILHKKHEIQYDDKTYVSFSKFLVEDILRKTNNDENVSKNIDTTYNLAKSIKYLIEKHSIEIKI
jgi:hypothetical protein